VSTSPVIETCTEVPAALVAGPPLLEIENLHVYLPRRREVVRAIDGASVTVRAGESIGIIGESGSGKSMLARTIIGLLPNRRAEVRGSVRFEGRELVGLAEREMQRLRGKEIALVPQDPSRSLNPTIQIGKQIVEAIRVHTDVSAAEAKQRAIELLGLVRMPSASTRFSSYPHQLSGGMRQRVVIAMALSCNPKLLIADEATTALDVTTQAQILDLLGDLQRDRQMTLILISHDMGVVASHTDHIAVMYAGRIVEEAATEQLFDAVRMPYTRALLDAIPSIDNASHAKLAELPGRTSDGIPLIGCAFAPRCIGVQERCRVDRPELLEDEPGHRVACHFPLEAAKR
jgi:oligopeptide/dipeptide ABC transporter ATP-binding protein